MTRLGLGIVTGIAIGVVLGAACGIKAQEQVTTEDVHVWISDYAWWYETDAWPHDALVARVLAVARCETGGWDERVINNVRRGRYGEIGVGQWMPGGIWRITPQAQAGYSVLDPEANTAALVWAISQGLGPRNWTCW